MPGVTANLWIRSTGKLKTKKEQIRIINIFQCVGDLAKSEQKRYIFSRITGMSGLH